MVTTMSTVAVAVPPDAMDFSKTVSTFMLALISDLKASVVPSSATASTSALAVSPLLQKVALPLCTAPIKGEKCAPDGRPPVVTLVVHLPSNVTR